MAHSHLSRPIAESSIDVPTLTLNCFLGWLPLHSQRLWLARKLTSLRPHVGHSTPCGQRREAAYRTALSGFEKYTMASWSVFGSFTMDQLWSKALPLVKYIFAKT